MTILEQIKSPADLKSMSDAQLAQWLEQLTGNPTENLLRWLRAPAETNEEETPWKTI